MIAFVYIIKNDDNSHHIDHIENEYHVLLVYPFYNQYCKIYTVD